MTNRFSRTTVFCADLDASLALYRDLLGFVVVEEKQLSGVGVGGLLQLPDCTIRIALLAEEEHQHPLIGLFEITGIPLEHTIKSSQLILGQSAIVITTDDFDGLYRRLETAGVRFLRTPIQYPKLTASAFSPAGLYREMIFYDPDGVLISAMQIVPLD